MLIQSIAIRGTANAHWPYPSDSTVKNDINTTQTLCKQGALLIVLFEFDERQSRPLNKKRSFFFMQKMLKTCSVLHILRYFRTRCLITCIGLSQHTTSLASGWKVHESYRYSKWLEQNARGPHPLKDMFLYTWWKQNTWPSWSY